VDDLAELHRLLARTGRALARWDRRAAARHGLSTTALAVLVHLAASGPHSHRDLAVALDVAPATLTPVVDGLERTGDVVRSRDPRDRRVVLVSVTAAGRARGAGTRAAVAAEAAGVLPAPADRAAVHRWLTAVHRALEAAEPLTHEPPTHEPLIDESSSEPDRRPAPAVAGQVEAGGQGAHAAVQLHGDRHLRDARARVAQA
jgi:DNA-binding MarR family transcriptional regulator